MFLEIAIGTAFAFLWSRFERAADSKDLTTSIRKALEASVNEGFTEFESKYPDFAESFLDDSFLEDHVCPRIYTNRD